MILRAAARCQRLSAVAGARRLSSLVDCSRVIVKSDQWGGAGAFAAMLTPQYVVSGMLHGLGVSIAIGFGVIFVMTATLRIALFAILTIMNVIAGARSTRCLRTLPAPPPRVVFASPSPRAACHSLRASVGILRV